MLLVFKKNLFSLPAVEQNFIFEVFEAVKFFFRSHVFDKPYIYEFIVKVTPFIIGHPCFYCHAVKVLNGRLYADVKYIMIRSPLKK